MSRMKLFESKYKEIMDDFEVLEEKKKKGKKNKAWIFDVIKELENLHDKFDVPKGVSFKDHFGTAKKMAEAMIDKMGYSDAIKGATVRFNLNQKKNKFMGEVKDEILKLKPDDVKTESLMESVQDSNIVYESPDKKVIIYKVLTIEDLKKYGKDTFWAEQGTNFLGRYLKDRSLFIIDNKKVSIKDPKSKVAILTPETGDKGLTQIYDINGGCCAFDKAEKFLADLKIPELIFEEIEETDEEEVEEKI